MSKTSGKSAAGIKRGATDAGARPAKSRKTGLTVATGAPSIGADTTSCKAAHKRKGGGETRESAGWFCRICNKFVYGTEKMPLMNVKASHIAKVHPEIPKKRFPRTNAQVIVPVKPARELPKPHWRCAWCHQGLPKLPTDVYICSLKMHLRHCVRQSISFRSMLAKIALMPSALQSVGLGQASKLLLLQRMAYNSFWVLATSNRQCRGRIFWRGGICVATINNLPSRKLHTWSDTAGDAVMMDYGSFRALSLWRRPEVDREAFDCEVEHLFGEAASAQVPCVAIGDFNDTPEESELPELGLSITAPMEGALDWAAYNDPCLDMQATFHEAKLGDHKLLQLSWTTSFERHAKMELKPTVSYRKPPEVTDKAWREAVQHFFDNVEVDWYDDVDEQWIQLGSLIEQAAGHAYTRLQCQGPWRTADSRAKGSQPDVRPIVQGGRQAGRRNSDVWLVQKLCKFLGRLMEATRHDEVDARRKHWPAEVPRSSFEQAVDTTRTLLSQTRASHKYTALRDWRKRMEAGGKPATRWLNNRVCALPAAVVDTVDNVTRTSRSTYGALQLLRDFWRRVWW